MVKLDIIPLYESGVALGSSPAKTAIFQEFSMHTLKQCLLSKGNECQTAWIEERGAIKGASVELKELNEFWKVEEVYHGAITAKEAQILRDNHRKHRISTDI